MRTAEVLEVLEVRPLPVAEEGPPPAGSGDAGPPPAPVHGPPAPVTA